MTALAIMQPYMWSAWGYYRLLAAADLFVVYDDAQYIKGGWINRNKFTNKKGEKEWFTLPLKDHSLHTKIKDLQWAENHEERIEKEMKKFPVFKKLGLEYPWGSTWRSENDRTPCDAIEDSIHWVMAEVGVGICKTIDSSGLSLPPRLRGQEKVIEICKYFRATKYINLSGGKDLYNKRAFEEGGIDLQFLPEVVDKTNILERIAQVGVDKVREEIYANLS